MALKDDPIARRDAATVIIKIGPGAARDPGTAAGSGGTIVRRREPGAADRSLAAVISRVTWVGMAVNVALAVLKLAAGVMGKSHALVADAAHTLSDLATDAAILIGVRYWCEPADEMHPHGHAKIETVVTAAIGLALAAVGVGLGYEAVAAVTHAVLAREEGQTAAPSILWVGFGAAVLSIICKEFLYRWTVKWGRALKSSALVANAWHHRSDALSSIPPALAIGGWVVGSWFGRDLWFLDPIGAVVVCAMLLHAAWGVVKPALQSLLDAGADRKTCDEIERIILDTPDVLGAHRIRSRYAGPNAVEVDFHLLVEGSLSVVEGHAIAKRVKARLLASNLAMIDVVIHVEPVEEVQEEDD